TERQALHERHLVHVARRLARADGVDTVVVVERRSLTRDGLLPRKPRVARRLHLDRRESEDLAGGRVDVDQHLPDTWLVEGKLCRVDAFGSGGSGIGLAVAVPGHGDR